MATPKKRILFVNESLACAGGEKSLLNLLSSLDYTRYDVDLQLFRYGCPWDRLVPQQVNMLPALEYSEFLDLPLLKAIQTAFRKRRFRWIISRLRYTCSLHFGKKKRIPEVACKFWEYTSACFSPTPKHYDVAIGYAQGFPTFYVADRVNATKKIAWINATYRLDGWYRDFVRRRFDRLDVINAVSATTKEVLLESWPETEPRISIFMDLINPQVIRNLSQEHISLKRDESKLTLLTIGRLQQFAKGYDLLLQAADILNRKAIDFIWYILGTGDYRAEMVQYIQDHNLTDKVILLGVKPNPYPYLKLADIYVQTSRQEGFGIALAEARILNIPVITTRFNSVEVQIKDNINGLICGLDPESIAECIVTLCQSPELYSRIQRHLETEKKGNLESLPDFYDIIEN